MEVERMGTYRSEVERVGTFPVSKGQVLCAPNVGIDSGTRGDTGDPASA